jgi:hypothetical protein
MPIDSRARAFVEANMEHYREVTLAVQGFEAEVQSMLRSSLREFGEQLGKVGVKEEAAVFKVLVNEDVSDMSLRSRSADIEIGIGLQSRDDIDGKRFAVYAWVWVKDPGLRKLLDHYVGTHACAPFVHEFESGTTFLTAYLDPTTMPQAIDLLRDACRALFECLFGSPEFCKSFNLSGPTHTVVHG